MSRRLGEKSVTRAHLLIALLLVGSAASAVVDTVERPASMSSLPATTPGEAVDLALSHAGIDPWRRDQEFWTSVRPVEAGWSVYIRSKTGDGNTLETSIVVGQSGDVLSDVAPHQ